MIDERDRGSQVNRVGAPKDTIIDGKRVFIQKNKNLSRVFELVELSEFQPGRTLDIGIESSIPLSANIGIHRDASRAGYTKSGAGIRRTFENVWIGCVPAQ